MKTLPELQDDLKHAIRAAADITDVAEKAGRQLDPNEKARYEKYFADVAVLKASIAEIEDRDNRRRRVDAELAELAAKVIAPRAPAVQPSAIGTPPPVAHTPSITAPRVSRFGALKAFKGATAEQDAYKAGLFIRAAILNDGGAARLLRDNFNFEIRNDMGINTNSTGGFLVPNEFSQAIIDLREIYGVFRQNARVRPMSSDVQMIPRVSGHVTAYFTNEATAITTSNMTLDQVQMVAKKLGVLTYISSELEEDAMVSVVDTLANDIAWAMAYKEDLCGFSGDGTSTYGGIRGLTHMFTAAGGTGGATALVGSVDAASGHDTFAEIDATDLTKLMGILPQYARNGAKWYCSQVAADMIFGRLSAAAGGNTIQTIQGGYQLSYLGYPVVTSQVLPTSTGDLSDLPMLFFGNLPMSSSLAERRGIMVGVSTEIKFAEDQIGVKATERIDINNHDVGTTSAAGPIVALIGE